MAQNAGYEMRYDGYAVMTRRNGCLLKKREVWVGFSDMVGALLVHLWRFCVEMAALRMGVYYNAFISFYKVNMKF